MNFWVLVYRFAWALFIVLVLFGIICVFLPKSHTLRYYQKRRLELEEENRQLAGRVADLVERQSRFRADPAFVERTARDAGMIKSNEVTFVLDDPEEE